MSAGQCALARASVENSLAFAFAVGAIGAGLAGLVGAVTGVVCGAVAVGLDVGVKWALWIVGVEVPLLARLLLVAGRLQLDIARHKLFPSLHSLYLQPCWLSIHLGKPSPSFYLQYFRMERWQAETRE